MTSEALRQRVIGRDFQKPCVGCGALTNDVLRRTGDHLCQSCLRQWLTLRALGWPGDPADLAGVEWLKIPGWLIEKGV